MGGQHRVIYLELVLKMKTAYAFSVVFRDSKDGMKHYINHCWATSKQEARGYAHEQFEELHPNCKLLSLLIREIVPDSDQTETTTHEYVTPRIRPEFTLKNNF